MATAKKKKRLAPSADETEVESQEAAPTEAEERQSVESSIRQMRSTFHELPLDERAAMIHEYVHIKRLKQTSVAAMFGVHRNTVKNLLRRHKASRRAYLNRADQVDLMTDALLTYEDAKHIAMQQLQDEASKEKPNAIAVSALVGAVLRSQELSSKLLVDTGFIKKAPSREEIELQITGGLDIKSMSTEEIRRNRDRIAERLLGMLGGEGPRALAALKQLQGGADPAAVLQQLHPGNGHIIEGEVVRHAEGHPSRPEKA